LTNVRHFATDKRNIITSLLEFLECKNRWTTQRVRDGGGLIWPNPAIEPVVGATLSLITRPSPRTALALANGVPFTDKRSDDAPEPMCQFFDASLDIRSAAAVSSVIMNRVI
jgi:hypothetical protein